MLVGHLTLTLLSGRKSFRGAESALERSDLLSVQHSFSSLTFYTTHQIIGPIFPLLMPMAVMFYRLSQFANYSRNWRCTHLSAQHRHRPLDNKVTFTDVSLLMIICCVMFLFFISFSLFNIQMLFLLHFHFQLLLFCLTRRVFLLS